jgi:hypothetical protein
MHITTHPFDDNLALRLNRREVRQLEGAYALCLKIRGTALGPGLPDRRLDATARAANQAGYALAALLARQGLTR